MYKPDLSLQKYAISVLLLLPLIRISSFESLIHRHSSEIIIFGVYMPIACMVTVTNRSSEWIFLSFVSTFILLGTVNVLGKTKLIQRLNSGVKFGISSTNVYRYIRHIFALALAILVLANYDKINFNIYDTFLRTYDIRAENHANGLFGYFIGWAIFIFFPLLIASGNGKLITYGNSIAFLSALYIFSAFAVKGIFLNYILVLFFYISYHSSIRLREYIPFYFIASILLLGMIAGDIGKALLDRFFYLIGTNSIYYFEYFSSSPLRYFEGSKMDFGISNSGIGVGYLIDQQFYSGAGSNQTAGFLPTMFSDLGRFGVVIGSIIIGISVHIISSLRHGMYVAVYLIAMAFSFSLMNHSLNMLFLSNGLILLYVLVFIIKKKRKDYVRDM